MKSSAAERAGQTLFSASFSPCAALATLILTRTLAMARDVMVDGLVLLTVSAIATGILLAAGRPGEGRAALRWCGMALLAFATQIALAFAIVLVWVAVVHPDRARPTSHRGKERPYRGLTPR